MYRLLIVDDEYIERYALKFVVENNCSGISYIEEASNGREAIAKASSFHPHILIIDIKMPGINGIEAAKEIKRVSPDCKIVFLTAYDYFDYAKEAIRIGVEDFIIKPAANEQVVEVVNRIAETLNKESIEINKKAELMNKYEQIKDYLENELVYSIMTRDFDEDQIKEYLLAMGIEFKQGLGVVINIDYDYFSPQNASHIHKNMVKKRSIEKIREMIEQPGLFCLMNHMDNKIYILIIWSKDDSADDVRNWSVKQFNDIYRALNEQLLVKTRIGIGDSYKAIKQMVKSFLEARTSVSLEGYTQSVVHIRDVEQGSKSNLYPSKKEKLLLEKISMGDEEAIVILDEILDWISWHFDSMEDFKRKVYELIVVISRVMSNEIKVKSNDPSICLKDIKMMNSKGGIKVYVRTLLKSIISDVDLIKLDKAGSLIEKVREYINHNYMKEITLDDMAGMVGLSTFYFSKIFKFYQKINFIDYLTSVRINKAKELLANPKINIKEISGMIGYSDPNYFARVFKRLVGITPTEYRNKKILLQQ